MINKKIDIIFFTLSRWDSPISSPSLALAKEFSRNNRVFYIDHPYSYKDYFKLRNTPAIKSRKNALFKGENKYKNVTDGSYNFTVVTSQLTYPINFLPPGKLYNHFSRINDNKILEVIRDTIKDFNIQDFIFINAYDPFFVRDFPADIKPLLKVYQSMDDISQEAYTARHGERLESEIIRKYDITLATSRELQRIKSQDSRFVFYHPNAADLSLFSKATEEKLEKPADLEGVDKPIIGYTGQIGSRINFELLKKVAKYHSDKLIYMVGPLGDNEYKTVNLDQMENVIFTGPKKIEELPNYLQYMDCTLIPFKCNTLTKSIYPLKINEYLAAGKAVIATNFSEEIASFKNVIYLSETLDEYVHNIDKAIKENNEGKIKERIKIAQQNTWKARVASFWDIVEKYYVEEKETRIKS